MPRSQARIRASIWQDKDFTSLPGSAQRLYFMLLSQPTLGLCGVLPYQPNRWAATCSDDTPECLVSSLALLEERRYIVTDLSTEEVLIRTLMRNDGVSPSNGKIWKAALSQIKAVASARIRAELEAERIRIESGSDEEATEHDEEAIGKQPGSNPDSPIDTPRTCAHAASLLPPPSSLLPPPTRSGADRFADAYVRHKLEKGGVKNPQRLRAWALKTWGPWAEERFTAASYSAEELVDMAIALGKPPANARSA